MASCGHKSKEAVQMRVTLISYKGLALLDSGGGRCVAGRRRASSRRGCGELHTLALPRGLASCVCASAERLA
jgi:hypothetical protein